MARMAHLLRSIRNGDSNRLRAIRSTGWVAGAGVFEQALRFGRNMILARLLAPEAFGRMAIVFACYGATELFTGVALAPAVIHDRRGHEPAYLNAAWWLSVLRGVLVYLAAIPLCPLIADWYNRPDLVPLLRIVFASILLRAFTSPVLYSRAKALTFRDLVLVQAGGSVVGVAVALLLAARSPSALALAAGHVTEDATRLILSHLICPFRPRLRIDRACLWSMLRYTRRMVGMSVFTFIFLRTDTFVLGKTVSGEQLGYYTMAAGLAVIPVTLVTRLFGQLLTPTFAILQNDAVKMRTALGEVVALVACIAAPLACAALFFGRALLNLVYGQAYGSAALPFGLLSVAAVLRICGLPMVSYYFAVGKPQLNRSFTVLRAAVLAAAIYPLVRRYGVTGGAVAVLFATAVACVVQLHTLKRTLGIHATELLRRFAGGAVFALWIPAVWTVARIAWGGSDVWHVVWCAIGCVLSYGFAAPYVGRHLVARLQPTAVTAEAEHTAGAAS
ncbi:MAG: oligosaccharide flippase family protein [Chitinivibrionales bacterium]|nr:oligosaccharide flippase family protein [Chitinivibrionales bacterium]